MDILAYIDESGDPSLAIGTKDVSRYFVVAAIIIKSTTSEELEQITNEIRRAEFSGSEIKSSNVRRKIDRRLRILESIDKIDFSSHIIAIDKSALSKNGGFIYKQPFLKYTNGLLYRKIFRSFQNLTIFCDQHGGNEFQNSFKDYLEENHRQDLFKDSTVTPVDSKLVNGVQIADFIAGSVREILEHGKSKRVYELIKKKASLIEIWPPLKEYLVDSNEYAIYSTFDNSVENYCLTQAKAYVERNLDKREDGDMIKLRIVEYLLAVYYSNESAPYVTTKEIMEEILPENDAKKEYYVRTKIAELRESDVIIASSSNGLKIPTTVADLSKYVEENKKKIGSPAIFVAHVGKTG